MERGIKGVRSFVLLLFFFFLIISILLLIQSSNPFDHSLYPVVIPRGATAKDIQRLLEAAKVLRPGGSGFALIARVTGVAGKAQAGQYVFSPSDNLFTILLKLRKGEVVQIQAARVKVTFPEGLSIYKMGEVLRKNGFRAPDQFQALAQEGITANLRQRHWGIFKYVPTESLEGYLYPDTYWFYVSGEADAMAEVMLKRFEAVVVPFWNEARQKTKFNLHEILTLASIVEKEAQQPSERPVIASVFYNRLKAGMPLAADPTVKYALERPSKKVYLNQLQVDSLYNTYKRRGLPPGPICNPGIESIKAVVSPAKTNYFFFVAKKDGSHIFSRNFEEHQKARQSAVSGN
jgi:UPF0755 protein